MGEPDPGSGDRGLAVMVHDHAAPALIPSMGPLDDPATWQDFEAFCLVRPLDDLDRPAANLFQPPL